MAFGLVRYATGIPYEKGFTLYPRAIRNTREAANTLKTGQKNGAKQSPQTARRKMDWLPSPI